MSKVKIITDSNSGILQKEGEDLGVFVIPMPFCINGKEYEEEITLSQEEFYVLLDNDANVSTSQPSTYYLTQLFENFLNDYDDIIYIPMSSGLSNTCTNAKLIANNYNGRVHVIDNKRISVTQKTSVYEAVNLLKSGKSANEIEDYLLNTSKIQSIYIYLDTLKYLKKGGRITPTAALLGNLLKIKPILSSRGENFEKFETCRTLFKAKEIMINQVNQELEGEFKQYYENGTMTISVAHTQNYEIAQEFKNEIIEKFPKAKFLFTDPLSLSVSCHIGAGALAIAISIDTTNIEVK